MCCLLPHRWARPTTWRRSCGATSPTTARATCGRSAASSTSYAPTGRRSKPPRWTRSHCSKSKARPLQGLPLQGPRGLLHWTLLEGNSGGRIEGTPSNLPLVPTTPCSRRQPCCVASTLPSPQPPTTPRACVTWCPACWCSPPQAPCPPLLQHPDPGPVAPLPPSPFPLPTRARHLYTSRSHSLGGRAQAARYGARDPRLGDCSSQERRYAVDRQVHR